MGTVFSVDVVTTEPRVAEFALTDIVAWWHWVDATFSTYRDDSVVSRMARGETTVAQAPPEVAEVLDLCAHMQRRTGGYFTARAAGSIDPTGLVKGWSVDVASARLQAAGFTDHCINGGGDIRAIGRTLAQQPWAIGIVHPMQRRDLLTVVHGTDLAVATSGTSERGAHIIDPFTGRPATALAAVTVVGTDIVAADAYATAAIAMGDGARPWLEQVARDDGLQALVVDPTGGTWRTAGWDRATSG